MTSIRLILGDQLNLKISSLQDINPVTDLVLMAEVLSEASYVPHHQKKLVFVFSAMRHFADSIKKKGYRLHYTRLTDKQNHGSLSKEVIRLANQHKIKQVIATQPGEYRVLEELNTALKKAAINLEVRADDRFICPPGYFKQWASRRNELTMEFFYREMRKKTRLLMNNGKPAGGKWNYDKQNRKPLKCQTQFTPPKRFKPDSTTQEVINMVQIRFASNMGDAGDFSFAVTEKQAKQALQHFIKHALPRFGDYQDAMLNNEPYLFHSFLSHYLNVGLLDPLDVCRQVEAAYQAGSVPLNSAEGFIRQIIGWREFIREVYWHFMPGYKRRNTLRAKRKLPAFYWTGDTQLNCLSQVITMTIREAYSHHIQRLMITGNFALLAGLDVQAVSDWYLAVYTDAFEWVELPNTLGMTLYADNGIVASKPYIASGAYIKRMSNFCNDCCFDVRQRTGDSACPFNFLYWHFVMQHEDKFENNQRMGFVYKNLNRFSGEEKLQIRHAARKFLRELK
ncbi:cryptochrome/photolyase family protein [Kaarinaea lacus]